MLEHFPPSMVSEAVVRSENTAHAALIGALTSEIASGCSDIVALLLDVSVALQFESLLTVYAYIGRVVNANASFEVNASISEIEAANLYTEVKDSLEAHGILVSERNECEFDAAGIAGPHFAIPSEKTDKERLRILLRQSCWHMCTLGRRGQSGSCRMQLETSAIIYAIGRLFGLPDLANDAVFPRCSDITVKEVSDSLSNIDLLLQKIYSGRTPISVSIHRTLKLSKSQAMHGNV